MFDVLVQIYEAYGYSAREAVAGIVCNNIWGLDIDDRAAQLAYFSVMMKARQYDHRFFNRGIQPHIYAIVESNGLTTAPLHDMGLELTNDEYGVAVKQAWRLIEETRDAKEYGSIINVTPCEWDMLRRFAIPRWESEGGQIPMEIHGEIEAAPRMQALINIGQALAQKYHVVVTNPPYMGSNGMAEKLNNYIKEYFPNSKNDLYGVFIERCLDMTRNNGCLAMITQHSWMFIGSFERLRNRLLQVSTLNMAHLGPRAFEEIGGEVVQTTAFVICNRAITEYKGTYCRLLAPNTQVGKENMFLAGDNRYVSKQSDYSLIPGAPIAYWVSKQAFSAFLGDHIADHYIVRNGISTGDNEKYLRLWPEIKSPSSYWKPCNKGGTYRKWYGNNDYVVYWKDNGHAIRTALDEKGRIKARLGGIEFSFSTGIEMSRIASGELAFRISEGGFVYESSTNDIYAVDSSWKLNWLLGYCNSKPVSYFLNLMNPTINIMPEDIRKLPCKQVDTSNVNNTVARSIEISRSDWDSFEISWDFQRHPLVIPAFELGYVRLSDCNNEWARSCDERFGQLKANEEELNRIFIDVYGLQNELTPEVQDNDVTVRRADLGRDIRSFISYAVGCMFGRYSLDEPGLIYAGGEWDASKYHTFIPDKDAILPICDDEYFEDDIVGRFVKFVETVYGKDTLEENLRFIADALGGKGSSREVIRNYFINDFYGDHLKIYQKRPIYWLFDSGKKNGFKCLIYMHRYQPDTIARIRTDYVHEQQSRYRTAITDLESRIANAGTGERVKLSKQLTKLQDQAEELRVYEEKIHHLADQMIRIDLDDGVKVNYAKFQDVLAKIK